MSAKQQPLAKFFCEFCDYEVPIDARFCPRCGHFFASVRCPVCGKIGDQSLFKHGCPKCGYASTPKARTNQTQSGNEQKQRRKIKFPKFDGSFNFPEGKSRKVTTGSLPIWVYIVVLILVLGILLLAEAVL